MKMKTIVCLASIFITISSISSQNSNNQSIKHDDPIILEYNSNNKNFGVPIDYFNQEMDVLHLDKSQLKLLKQSALLMKQNKINLALNVLYKIKVDDSQGYNIYYLRGIIEMKINDLDNAYYSFMKSIDYSSNNTFKQYMYMVIAGFDQKKGFIFNSLLNLKKSYEIDSTYVPVLMMLGKTYETLGRTDEAILYVKKAVEIDRTNVTSLLLLGTICGKSGRIDEAILYFKNALKIDPSLIIAKGFLVSIYQENNKHLDAIKALNEIIENNTDTSLKNTHRSIFYSQLSYSKLQLDLKEEALNDANKSILLYPENLDAYKNRALIYVAKGELEKACKDINKALDLGYLDRYKNQNEADDILLLQAQNCKK